jgi:hypothetical protein
MIRESGEPSKVTGSVGRWMIYVLVFPGSLRGVFRVQWDSLFPKSRGYEIFFQRSSLKLVCSKVLAIFFVIGV